jgi:hypothetical protein
MGSSRAAAGHRREAVKDKACRAPSRGEGRCSGGGTADLSCPAKPQQTRNGRRT